jgi:hypothetical protein
MKSAPAKPGLHLNFIGAFVREPVRRDQTDARSQGRLRRFGVHENDSLADRCKGDRKVAYDRRAPLPSLRAGDQVRLGRSVERCDVGTQDPEWLLRQPLL